MSLDWQIAPYLLFLELYTNPTKHKRLYIAPYYLPFKLKMHL